MTSRAPSHTVQHSSSVRSGAIFKNKSSLFILNHKRTHSHYFETRLFDLSYCQVVLIWAFIYCQKELAGCGFPQLVGLRNSEMYRCKSQVVLPLQGTNEFPMEENKVAVQTSKVPNI